MGSSIPVVPGAFSFLAGAGEALGKFQGAVDDREDRRRVQATQALGPIFEGIARGSIDPRVLATPEVAQQLAVLGTPAVTPEMVIPSVAGEQARAGVKEIQTTDPNTERGRAARGQSPLAAIQGAELSGWLTNFRMAAAQGDPEAARIMAEVPDLAEMIQRQAEPFNEIARSYVSSQGGDAKKAWNAAQQDPRLAPLIQSGELSERYFSDQATLYRQNEDAMQARLSALFREQRLDRQQQKNYISDQIKALDNYIKGLESSKPNVNPILKDLPAYAPDAIKADSLDSLVNQARVTRDSLYNVYTRAFPTDPNDPVAPVDKTTSTTTTSRVSGTTPGAPTKVNAAIAVFRRLQEEAKAAGKPGPTAADIDASTTITPEEKAQIKKALGL